MVVISCVYAMPKLRTFVEIHNWSEDKVLVGAPISRQQRSCVAKLKLGIPPLQIEVDRFKKDETIKPEDRYCRLCNTGLVEDEVHFLLVCSKLHDSRKEYLAKINKEEPGIFDQGLKPALRVLLDKSHVKDTSRWVEDMVSKRKELMYISK